jgi:hypothetical protein
MLRNFGACQRGHISAIFYTKYTKKCSPRLNIGAAITAEDVFVKLIYCQTKNAAQ